MSRRSKFKFKLESRTESIRKHAVLHLGQIIRPQEISENNSFFRVNESGIKRLKKFDKSRVKGENPFSVCSINKGERNDHENLFIAEYIINNIEFFTSMDIDLIPYISKQLSAIPFK